MTVDPAFAAVEDAFRENFALELAGIDLEDPVTRWWPELERPFGTGLRSFGHFGAGGALGFADPDAGVAFGYVIAEMGPRWQNPRNRALLDALAACLG